MDRRTFSTALATGCFAAVSDAFGAQGSRQEWGDLSATFVYDGEPPAPKVLGPLPGMKLPWVDQSLLVDPTTKGIANLAIWLHLPLGEKPAIIHPGYVKLAKLPVRVDFRDGQLQPRIATIVTGQDVDFINNDPVDYDFKLDLLANSSFAKLLPSELAIATKFPKPETRPMPLTCAIQPTSGWAMIRNNPYMAVTGATGKLKIGNIPVGKHTFVLWHERCGFVTRAKKDGKTLEFKNGRITVDIKPGENDLGIMHIKPEKK